MTQTERLKARTALLKQEAEAAPLAEAAALAQEPYALAFHAAHNALLAMSRDRATHTKAEILAAYDARMHASHAWHPSRQHHRTLATWHAAIVRELRTLNDAIDRASDQADRPPPAPRQSTLPL